MIFKVVAGVAPAYIADLWNSSDAHSENETSTMVTTSAGHYKNRLVLANKWQNFNPREVCIRNRVTF